MTAIPALAAAPLLALIALSDLRYHRIRNRDIAALAAITAATVLAVAVPVGVGVVGDAVAGAVLAASPLVAAWVVQPGRMGGGDVKLAALVGALLGPLDLWLAVAAVGAALTVTLVAARRGPAPLAPAFVGAALLAVVVYVAAG